jgi:uncharacterized protein (DUF2062 family)
MKCLGRAFTLSLEGVSTETLVLSVGLALVLGIFPVYGCPTLLCAAAAIILRLNLPAMQLVNVLTSPLQIALLIPFHRLGELLLPAAGASDPRIPSAMHTQAWTFFAGIWTLAVHAIAGWSCVCVPLGILLYVDLRVRRRRRPGLRVAAQL